jgi:tetratricopeptide (TPR) repeat protein
LRLDPLPPESAEHLLGVLLGPDPGLEPLVRVLIKRTEGNPFFLEESVRTLVETGTLTGEPGAYRLVQPLPAVQVPATVHAVLAARLDRLSPGDKALLQAASVVGKDVPFALLEAIAGEPEEALRGALGRLQAAEFLYEARLFPDLEYTFKHALTHEVTYRSLLQDRRRLLHRQIIEVLERLYPQRLAEQVERLAHHAIRGEMWEHAFRYLRDGAAKAITRSAYREAIGFCEEALRVVPHFPDSRETLEQAIDIRFELRHALAQVEGYRTVRNHLQEAEKLATALGDRRRLGWVYDYLGNYHYNVGELEPAVQAATRALAIGADLGDLALTVAASFHLGGAHWRRGDYQEAAQVLGRTLEILAQRPEGERLGLAAPPSILVRVWLALVLAELGQFHDAVRHAAEAVRIAQDTRRDLDLTYAYSAQGVAYLRQGDLVRAIPPLERGLPRGRAAFPALVHELAGPLGCAYALSKRVAEALPLLMEAVDSAAAAEETGAHSILARYLGEGYLLADRADDAREAGDRALRLACEHGQRGNEAWALRLLGEIAARTDPPDVKAAEAHYRQALTLATELEMRPLVAHCHLGLGRLYRRTEDGAKATEHLGAAATMYREMGMRFWLEKAEAELKELA